MQIMQISKTLKHNIDSIKTADLSRFKGNWEHNIDSVKTADLSRFKGNWKRNNQ